MSPTRIGLLATGDEICQGVVVNTNAPTIADRLTEQGWELGQTLSVNDDQIELVSGLEYLSQTHDLIITIGGLGPTCDDLTRFALAEFTDTELRFFDESWDRICKRLTRLGLSIPENNRQQALFPDTATILPNQVGTADGCYVRYEHKLIIMLPGPPIECVTMFSEQVLPLLPTLNLRKSTLHLLKWRLLGVSESHIAERLSHSLDDLPLKIAYRASYPYLDCKIWVDQKQTMASLKKQINSLLSEYVVSASDRDASAECHDLIAKKQTPLLICDQATCGFLQSKLTSHETWPYLQFVDEPRTKQCPYLQVSGLDPFWQSDLSNRDQQIIQEAELVLSWQPDQHAKPIVVKQTVTIKHRFVIHYCVEWITYQLKTWLSG